MYANNPLLAETLHTHHAQVLEQIAQPGDFFSGSERVEMVHCAREALSCRLCVQRKNALSPSSVAGEHDHPRILNPTIVDVIHRVRTDPGRLTKSWFDGVINQISKQQYVEIVSVVASSVIIDTLHNALGLGVPQLPQAKAGRPRQQFNAAAVEDGAWVPILQRASATDPTTPEQPQTWNITRALGLVPSALELFFTTFRPHYALSNIHLSISQGQAEFVAARVSAMNECFY